MKQILIGKKGNQPFPIQDEYVSREHAVFTFDELTGTMTLTNKSRNCTYVQMGGQFQQIETCYVDANTIVRLGPYFTFQIRQLFQKKVVTDKREGMPPPPPPKIRKDISHLRTIAENYEHTKLEIEQKQSSNTGLKSMVLAGGMAGSAFTAVLPKILGTAWYYGAIGPVLGVIFVVYVIIHCGKVSKDLILKKNDNEKKYKIMFCCPNCHISFVGKLYENILAEGKCRVCKTEFYDSKL